MWSERSSSKLSSSSLISSSNISGILLSYKTWPTIRFYEIFFLKAGDG